MMLLYLRATLECAAASHPAWGPSAVSFFGGTRCAVLMGGIVATSWAFDGAGNMIPQGMAHL